MDSKVGETTGRMSSGAKISTKSDRLKPAGSGAETAGEPPKPHETAARRAVAHNRAYFSRPDARVRFDVSWI